ncbi:MAG: amino acid ABC transporter substrate-binding protein [Rhizobiales bacterium]|nr:amino acid ABC transporter substrate-binding protein [Hyphomicrobiales bacterium]
MKLTSLVFASVIAGVMSASAAWAGDIGVGNATYDGGDGSYKRAREEGITLLIAADPPNTYQDEKTKEYDGTDVRIFREITKRLGIEKVTWQLIPFDAMVPTLLANRGDVIVDNLHENEKRLKVLAFTGPSYWYGSGVTVAKGNPLNIHSWDDFAGKTVGTLRGSVNHGLLEKRTDLKELKLYTSNEAEFSDIIAGRLDVGMEDDIKVGQFLKKHPDAAMELVADYKPLPEEYGYARYALRKEDVDLNSAISRALAEIRADGTMSAIIKEFGYTDRNLWFFPVEK